MGNQQSTGERDLTPEQKKTAITYPDGMKIVENHCIKNLKPGALAQFNIIDENDPQIQEVQDMLMKNNDKCFTLAESRAVGSLMGNVVGDAIGAPLEFSSVRYIDEYELNDMPQPEIWNKFEYNRFKLKAGQWTDDASMALCIADTLLINGKFEPKDLRLRFLCWWKLGYNNAFGNDNPIRSSVGLGGNISGSFSEFEEKQTEYTTAGNRQTSGNGSIMRGCPVPIFYHDDYDKALDFSYKQSKTTHMGDEAAEMARLLAHVIVKAINSTETDPLVLKKNILDNLGTEFKSSLYTATCLAKAECESKHKENEQLNLNDRKWNWKDDDFRFCESRAAKQPGYIGSYAMDGMSMALHCLYKTSSFKDAVLKCANYRGDADTTAAITAQMAGAIYGVYDIPINWINTVQQWDNKMIAVKAFKLFKKIKVTL